MWNSASCPGSRTATAIVVKLCGSAPHTPIGLLNGFVEASGYPLGCNLSGFQAVGVG
jgi:hypothetical protein